MNASSFNADIPVIAVRDNKCAYNNTDNRIIYVENYLEAAGVCLALKAGITEKSVLSR